MDRKDLLLESSSMMGSSIVDEDKLRKVADDGSKYIALVNSPGWKDLCENFINPRLSQDRYLSCSRDELADVRAAQKELSLLLKFVNSKVDEGIKAYQQLKKA